jgi:DNA polymerase family B, exonuclease domain
LREANGDDDAVAVATALSLPAPVLPAAAAAAGGSGGGGGGVGGVGGGGSSGSSSVSGGGVGVTGASAVAGGAGATTTTLQPSTDPLSLSLLLSLPLPVPLHIPSSNPPSPSPSFSPSPALLIPPLQPSLLSTTKFKTPTPFSPYNAHTIQEKKNKMIEIKKKNLRDNQIFKKLLKKEKMIFSAMTFPGSWTLEFALDERELFSFFSAVMHKHDPDIIIGYEVQKESLGYLLKRGDVMGK